jgi:hypothetical protein
VVAFAAAEQRETTNGGMAVRTTATYAHNHAQRRSKGLEKQLFFFGNYRNESTEI